MLTLWLATGLLAGQEAPPPPATTARGDDAFFRTSGQSRQFFYDKQIAELEEAADRLVRPGKTRARRAAAVIAAFEPIDIPTIAPPSSAADLRAAIQSFKAVEIDAAELRNLVLAQAEAMRKRIRRRNDEAALVLMLS